MTDEAYVFRQTELERKRTGRGDFNKKRQGGRRVRLPSDNMTQKEWKKMNGTVKTYNMNAPVSWREFSSWPNDIQCEYIVTLMEKYNVGTPELAKMFGISSCSVRARRKELGIAGHLGGRRGEVSPKWELFLAEAHPVYASSEKVDEETEIPSEKVEPPADEDEVIRLAALLSALKGTGAKLTIEVTL
jgi:hypothetical protein